jgi:hypothetical protein
MDCARFRRLGYSTVLDWNRPEIQCESSWFGQAWMGGTTKKS